MLGKIVLNKFSILWIIIISIITFNYLSFNYFIKSFTSLENRENARTLSVLINYIDSKFSTMKSITNDYSYWDDTYEFINNANKEYIYANFRENSATLENINLAFMLFVNSENQNIHTQIVKDLEIKNKDEFINHILKALDKSTKSSIMEYENKYYYLIKTEILKSDLTGTPRGFIYSGKIIDLKSYNNDFYQNIQIIKDIPTKIDSTLNSKFINTINVYFEYKNNILSNIISLKSNGQHLITFKLDNYREIYKEGENQLALFNCIVSIFILILFSIFYVYIYYHKKLNILLEKEVKNEIKKQKAQEEMLIHKSRSAEIGEMINNIAHQWRQPLNNLTLIIQNISFTHKNETLTQKSLDETIEKSKIIINSMSNTIDTFRDFFEPCKNKNIFKIGSSINNTIEILSSTLKFHNIQLTKEINNDIELFNYENELSQVLLNLITNARDALVSKKIKLPKIKIHVYQLENKAIIKIEDNAKGIDNKIIDRIFEPYFTTKEKGQGTGIGLYMSKIIIEKNMHGKLEVNNNKEGAVFQITLPINTK